MIPTIIAYRTVASSLEEACNVPVQLWNKQLVQLYAGQDLQVDPTIFTTLPKTPSQFTTSQAAGEYYQLVGVWADTHLLGYLSAGPLTDVSAALPHVMANLVNHPPQTLTQTPQAVALPALKKDPAATDLRDPNEVLSIYVGQNHLMEAIETGNRYYLNQLSMRLPMTLDPFLGRLPNRQLRAAKNIMFVFNTLCRLAAERGGASRLMIDQLSGQYALQIEALPTIARANQLIQELPEQYCELVRIKRNQHISPCVAATIDYVMRRYKEDLTLQAIADAVHAAPAYLSRRFRQDTCEPLFTFINHYRVRMAQNALKNGPQSIAAVAYEVGFNSVPYFNRIFRRVTGTTPRQYLTQHG